MTGAWQQDAAVVVQPDSRRYRRITITRRLHEIKLVEFDLRPETRWKLPPEPAPLVDRLMTWRTNDLVYSRPCDTPRFTEVLQVAQRLHAQATSGRQLGVAQRAHLPEDPRGGHF
ncbi:hypothetical protein [Ornithinimicrobium ciconiae]|uniref:hypothetical protein n=1 Tax=Ornithinimicrobium ciconiae TaxID=2594265 RepID=UPI001D18E403|nr:hypothetical protein [Ornithinimicrobium ciconiae]